ncbi:MAG: methyltransferase [Rhodovibrionaceae bacterium]|nr:methyltransferase [Rhodovibrionaceae bacterium]
MARVLQNPEAFIRANTVGQDLPLVPEIRLYLAHELTPIWQASETELEQEGVPPPYWAFAWAGGQALARYILDHPEVVAGARVLDFAAGSGVQAIAAKMAGAEQVEASEIDPFAIAAIDLNARENGVEVELLGDDVVGLDDGWDVVLAGDVCYEKPMAERVWDWLVRLRRRGADVLLGDPGRTYLPKQGLERITAYSVKTTREIEDTDLRNAVVWRVE